MIDDEVKIETMHIWSLKNGCFPGSAYHKKLVLDCENVRSMYLSLESVSITQDYPRMASYYGHFDTLESRGCLPH